MGEQLVTLGEAEAKRFAALPEELSASDRQAAPGEPAGANGEPAPASP